MPQTLAPAIAIGQSADVLINERPHRKYPARVVRTAGTLDAASRTLLVELELNNEDHTLLPGGYAQVRFTEARTEVPLTIPSNTLIFRPTGPHVGVVDSNNVVELRNISVGRDFGASVEITQGLTAQDRLVLNPPDSLTTGTHVRLAKPAAPPTASPPAAAK